MFRKASSSIAVLSLLHSSPSYSQEIDISAELRKILFSGLQKIPMPRKGSIQLYCLPDDSIEGDKFIRAIMQCKYRFDNVRTVSSRVNYSAPQPAAIPESIVTRSRNYVNCGNKAVPIQDTISISSLEGVTFTANSSLTYGNSRATTAGVTVPVQAVSFNYSKTEQVSFSRQEQEGKQTNFQETVSTIQAISVDVPPRSIHTVSLSRTLSNAFINFDGIVALNADVILIVDKKPQVTGKFNIRDNEFSIGKLSDFVPEESERTVTLKGQIWNAKGIKDNRVDNVQSISEKSDWCLAQSSEAENKKEVNRSLLRAGLNSINSQYLPAGMQVTQSFISGQVINTSNSVANIEVRAKSLGPGFCAVGIQGNSGSANFLAPPFAFSPWTHLLSHIGAASVSLTTTIGCDTGALFEVRYYR